ncbi:hypothetical protein I546_0864 [Mycobacterium kansasii 732]|nr:hypothetical protein I546_6066 [Mycobacterium kansasii 732]EUA11968.1 hypothetical protein I546_2686 [Mycobacterium kansasii 732]EUA12193.1 hypothetical protein I546_2669 [Mycobacterium kansasii 732]EUA14253.1 hypothetical protein I546_0041 [Mycobacterium kansasii 732]EUA15047.1 hypothetical protein I546_0864 [Mycobacterium kansasii 732]
MIPTDNSAGISLKQRSHRRSQSAAREVQTGRAASPLKPHHRPAKSHEPHPTRPGHSTT